MTFLEGWRFWREASARGEVGGCLAPSPPKNGSNVLRPGMYQSLTCSPSISRHFPLRGHQKGVGLDPRSEAHALASAPLQRKKKDGNALASREDSTVPPVGPAHLFASDCTAVSPLPAPSARSEMPPPTAAPAVGQASIMSFFTKVPGDSSKPAAPAKPASATPAAAPAKAKSHKKGAAAAGAAVAQAPVTPAAKKASREAPTSAASKAATPLSDKEDGGEKRRRERAGATGRSPGRGGSAQGSPAGAGKRKKGGGAKAKAGGGGRAARACRGRTDIEIAESARAALVSGSEGDSLSDASSEEEEEEAAEEEEEEEVKVRGKRKGKKAKKAAKKEESEKEEEEEEEVVLSGNIAAVEEQEGGGVGEAAPLNVNPEPYNFFPTPPTPPP